jgi:hypothetical protein
MRAEELYFQYEATEGGIRPSERALGAETPDPGSGRVVHRQRFWRPSVLVPHTPGLPLRLQLAEAHPRGLSPLRLLRPGDAAQRGSKVTIVALSRRFGPGNNRCADLVLLRSRRLKNYKCAASYAL